MRRWGIVVAFCACCAAALADDDPIDRLEGALSKSFTGDSVRMRLSGTLDLEAYELQQPAPSLVYAESVLFNPRLSLFLDAQLGSQVYVFAESRVDRGFDPAPGGGRMRLDEYALRYSPGGTTLLNLQAGKFATVVGNWVGRHGSWENPFVTAPLPYENLTGLWDTDAARSVPQLLAWAGLRPRPSVGGALLVQSRNIPIIWGPNYATGASAFGTAGRFQYALEVKNAALSSRPGTWNSAGPLWDHPAVSGRIGYTPSIMWNLGVSASSGPYLRDSAAALVPDGRGLGDYRETLAGADASLAWHHFEGWAEVYEARFRIPGVGNADSTAYYVEGKLKFAPQWFGALRWNQALFSSLPDGKGGSSPWSRPVSRIDAGLGHRFTAHLQLKLQYSFQHEQADQRKYGHLLALQLTMRF